MSKKRDLKEPEAGVADSNWKSTVAVIFAALCVVLVGLFTNYEDRFWVLGTAATLLFYREKLSRYFIFFYGASLLLCFLSLRVDIFYALILVVLSEALLLTWNFHRSDWTKETPISDTSLLVPVMVTIALLFAYYIRAEYKMFSEYLIVGYFFVRPLLWSRPQNASHYLEYFFCIVSLGVAFHLFPMEKSTETAFTLAMCTLLLNLFGHRLAVPLLSYMVCHYLNPQIADFAGVIAFSVFYGGWALRTGLLGLIFLFCLHGEYLENGLFWGAIAPLCLLLGYIWSSQEVSLKNLKQDWDGVLISLVLLATPLYLQGESLLEKADPQSPTLFVPPIIFITSAALFYFWKPKWNWNGSFAKNTWEKFTCWFASTKPHEHTKDATRPYRFPSYAGEDRVGFFQKEDFNLSLWMFFIVLGVWGVFLAI